MRHGGGTGNQDIGSKLFVQNRIVWGDSDGSGGTDDLDAQLFYSPGTLLWTATSTRT